MIPTLYNTNTTFFAFLWYEMNSISLFHMSVYLFSEWMHRISFLFLLLFHNNLSGDTKLGCTNIFLKKLVVIVEQFWGDFTVIVEDFHTTSWKIKKTKDSFQFCNRGVLNRLLQYPPVVIYGNPIYYWRCMLVIKILPSFVLGCIKKGTDSFISIKNLIFQALNVLLCLTFSRFMIVWDNKR